VTRETVAPSRVIALRKAMGQTAAEFAEHFGVSRQTVHNWEAGRTKIEGPAVVLLKILGGKFEV
jgi:DNA-binding transcriptional regulator YiaG